LLCDNIYHLTKICGTLLVSNIRRGEYMAVLNKSFNKWLIIIAVIIGVFLVIVLFIRLLPIILLLLAGLWIYSKLTKFSFGKRKEKESNYESNNNIPNNEIYYDTIEFDKDKVVDVDFVEENKKN
jgi:chromate transport protein ChrA